LGEVPSPNVLNVRCSIIGRELNGGSTSFVGWLESQPPSGVVRGYTDHRWNGVTTQAFAQLARALAENSSELCGTVHWLPADVVSKDQLARLVLDRVERGDVTVTPYETGTPVDRTLSTLRPEGCAGLWNIAGYGSSPTIADLIRSMP
jgi:dTDP-4-dehydrorhamnose reductase